LFTPPPLQDSGGVMDRVVSQLLAELDGVQGGGEDLFVIGASNRPDLIDAALLRPGRFDKLLYVGIAADVTSRVRILEALTRKFEMAPGVDLAAVAALCPPQFTGADLYALCADAWMVSARRALMEAGFTPGGEAAGEGEPTPVAVVRAGDFSAALAQLTPSLSREEIGRYERLRAQFEGR